MKLNLLIVDDDMNYRYAMKEIIPWGEFKFKIVGEAVNGQQALKFVRENPVDLILSDISMPQMNGIELIQAIKKEFPNVYVLVLSAYDDFDFVKKALKYGAEDYILKYELDKDEVLKTILETKEKILKGKKNEKVNHLISNHKEVFIEDFLKNILIGKKNYSNEELRESFNAFDIPLDTLRLFVVIAHRNSPLKNNELDIILETSGQSVHVIYLSENLVGFICNINRMVSELEAAQVIRKFVKDVRRLLNPDDKFELTMGASNICNRAELLTETGNKAYNSLQSKLYHGKNRDYYWDSTITPKDKKFEISEKTLKELKKLATINDFKAISKILYAQEELIVQLKPNEKQVNQILVDLLLTIYSGLEILDLNNSKNLELIQSLMERIRTKDTFREKITIIYEYISHLDESLVNSKYSIDIQKALTFIHENYYNKITLLELADHVQLSKNYICNLFKKEVGEPAIQYINKIRIEEAKRLIRESNMKVYEISETVGFQNTSYFSTVFKNITNQSIMQFKKQDEEKRRTS